MTRVPPPWQFAVPLQAHPVNGLEFATVPPVGNHEVLPFSIKKLAIESAR
ncbi:MAG TPA: hypothetical protein VG734_10725 [Lacunisphaera sp.]|nr:hypothetical protein [Lacunisphaera sp.]